MRGWSKRAQSCDNIAMQVSPGKCVRPISLCPALSFSLKRRLPAPTRRPMQPNHQKQYQVLQQLQPKHRRSRRAQQALLLLPTCSRGLLPCGRAGRTAACRGTTSKSACPRRRKTCRAWKKRQRIPTAPGALRSSGRGVPPSAPRTRCVRSRVKLT